MLKELQLDTDAYTGQYLSDNKKFAERQRVWRDSVQQGIANEFVKALWYYILEVKLSIN